MLADENKSKVFLAVLWGTVGRQMLLSEIANSLKVGAVDISKQCLKLSRIGPASPHCRLYTGLVHLAYLAYLA